MAINWAKEFKKFCRHKEAQAREAVIPGFMLVENRARSFRNIARIGSQQTNALFGGHFYASATSQPELPSTNVVFVRSNDGNTGEDNPGNLGAGETDHKALYEGLSRVHADAVAAGASTIRSNDGSPVRVFFSVWRDEMVKLRQSLGKPRHPAQIIISGRGEIDMSKSLIFNGPADVRVFVLTTDRGFDALLPQASRREQVILVRTGDELDLKAGFETLKKDYGISAVSLVGGRRTATTAIDSGIVQDLYLVTSAKPGGEPGTPFYLGAKDLENEKNLVQRMKGAPGSPEEGVIFEHFRIS